MAVCSEDFLGIFCGAKSIARLFFLMAVVSFRFFLVLFCVWGRALDRVAWLRGVAVQARVQALPKPK